MSKSNHRNLKVEALVLCGFSHDAVAEMLKGSEKITAPAVNGLMTRNGWDELRSGDGRAARLVAIGETSKAMRSFVDLHAEMGQAKAIGDLAGPIKHGRRIEAIRRLMLVKEMRGIREMPPELEPEMGLVAVRRATLARSKEDKLEMAFPDENKANCQLVFMAHKGWITEQEAIAGIKYRDDFNRIGGGLRSSSDWRTRVSGGGAGGHSPAFLNAMDKRKQCAAAIREIYPQEARAVLDLLHHVAVLNMSFRQIVTLGEFTLKPSAARLRKALEPVGWAYGDILSGSVASRLTSWWKAQSVPIADLEP